MRRLVTSVVVVAAVVLCCGSAFAGQTWTDGDGDGLPDTSPFVLTGPGPVSVGVWVDSQSFQWTNFLVFVEWNEACLDYVSATYNVINITTFPLDRFSNPSAVGFGGFGGSFQGVTLIGTVNLNYTGPGECCVNPIIDYSNPYGTYCALGNGPAYFLFTTNSASCWRQNIPDPVGACCFPNGTCADLTPVECVNQGGVPQGPDTSCATVTCPQPTEACCFPDGSCQDLPAADCAAAGGTPFGPGTDCATVIGCEGLPPRGACCFADGSCVDGLLQDECVASGGVYQGDNVLCSTVICDQPDPTGACCLPDGSCVDGATFDECVAAGGIYEGDDTLCSEVCRPDATESKSWGEIKGLFR